jgi:hypothetical protein
MNYDYYFLRSSIILFLLLPFILSSYYMILLYVFLNIDYTVNNTVIRMIYFWRFSLLANSNILDNFGDKGMKDITLPN